MITVANMSEFFSQNVPNLETVDFGDISTPELQTSYLKVRYVTIPSHRRQCMDYGCRFKVCYVILKLF